MTHFAIPQAYDAIAPTYDAALIPNFWMRAFLWRKYLQYFHPGDHILDVACGTGLDTLYLAQNQICVTGVDLSPRMLAELGKKAQSSRLTPRLNTIVGDFSHLPIRQTYFDGAISSFAGLNTTADLTFFAKEISRLLKPGSHLFIHMLNRFCVWEWFAFLGKGRWKLAKQYRTRKGINVSIAGVTVPHFLSSPSDTYRDWFSRDFELHQLYGLAVVRPPSHLNGLPAWFISSLEKLERYVNHLHPLHSWGYFFLLDMIKR